MPDLKETIEVKVLGLLRYNSFEEMFKTIDYNIAGKSESLEEKLAGIHNRYSEDREKTYGVLGIYMELIK